MLVGVFGQLGADGKRRGAVHASEHIDFVHDTLHLLGGFESVHLLSVFLSTRLADRNKQIAHPVDAWVDGGGWMEAVAITIPGNMATVEMKGAGH